jgi:methionyl-tRNA formyltransferase
MDEKMDHGPILAQEKVSLAPWPDHYAVVEEKLGRAGGALLAHLLPAWRAGSAEARPQDDAQATYVKMIKKEDGLLNLSDPAETNVRKVLAYSTWPGAYFFFKRRHGDEIRVVVRDAEIKDGLFVPTRVIPAGKREMPWSDFLRGNQ